MAVLMTSHMASIRLRVRDVLLRQTAPTVRVGTGRANAFTASPCPEPNGPRVARSGSSVDTEAGGDHLAQCFQAGGAIVLVLLHVDATAHIERLIAQAMAVLEQQQASRRSDRRA